MPRQETPMAITDLPFFQAIRGKLQFHEQRQQILAQNIANAETPGFRARDLRQPDFFTAAAGQGPGGVAPVATNARHIAASGFSTGSSYRTETIDGYEVTPDGNGVVLEEQMMKVAENQLEYQMATSLYQRGLGMLKTAIGRRA
jgi:flagellar basal-body rod protein FlgB